MRELSKYYVYLSDTKVDMLFDQQPRSHLHWLRSVNISIGPVGGGIQSYRRMNRYERLARVVSFLSEHDLIGNLDLPKSYFEGTMQLTYGEYGGERADAVYFSGELERDGVKTIVWLSGSMTNIIGKHRSSPKDHGGTQSDDMMVAVEEELDKIHDSSTEDEGDERAATQIAEKVQKLAAVHHNHGYVPLANDRQLDLIRQIRQLYYDNGRKRHVPQTFEFIAKTILMGVDEDLCVIVGSPLYVAMA